MTTVTHIHPQPAAQRPFARRDDMQRCVLLYAMRLLILEGLRPCGKLARDIQARQVIDVLTGADLAQVERHAFSRKMTLMGVSVRTQGGDADLLNLWIEAAERRVEGN